MNKTILVDVDGVLTNWEYAFELWMKEQGYDQVENGNMLYHIPVRFDITKERGIELIKFFNESAMIGFLPPLRDAIEYVTKLADEGWKFICITSLSTNPYAQKLRERNLKKLFGEKTFLEINCIETGADKDEALLKYKDSGMWWIEDKPDNALVGSKLGLKSLVMEHGYNMNDERVRLVKNWKEIYQIINGEDACGMSRK